MSDQRSREGQARHEFYDTAAWRALRRAVLAQGPLCVRCLEAGRPPVAATVVDHIVEFEKAPHLALDPANVQPLCASCHSGGKQWEEHHGMERGCGIDGVPRAGWAAARCKGPGGG